MWVNFRNFHTVLISRNFFLGPDDVIDFEYDLKKADLFISDFVPTDYTGKKIIFREITWNCVKLREITWIFREITWIIREIT